MGCRHMLRGGRSLIVSRGERVGLVTVVFVVGLVGGNTSSSSGVAFECSGRCSSTNGSGDISVDAATRRKRRGPNPLLGLVMVESLVKTFHGVVVLVLAGLFVSGLTPAWVSSLVVVGRVWRVSERNLVVTRSRMLPAVVGL